MHRSVVRGGGKARDLKARGIFPHGCVRFFSRKRERIFPRYIKEIFNRIFIEQAANVMN